MSEPTSPATAGALVYLPSKARTADRRPGKRPTAGSTRQNGFPPPTRCCCSATSVCRPRTLRRQGLQASSRARSSARRRDQLRHWAKMTRRAETCVTGMVLSILYFAIQRRPPRHDRRPSARAADLPTAAGIAAVPAAQPHASVHTTISVLEGLRLHELHRGRKRKAVRAARTRRPRIPPGAPALPLRPHRRDHQAGIPDSLSHRDGTTTSSALSTISRPSARSATNDLQTQSRSWSAASSRTGDGRCKTFTGTDLLQTRAARSAQAAGTPSAHSSAQVVAQVTHCADNPDLRSCLELP